MISGTARGIRLEVPPGNDVRPTIDRVREATFNALFSLGLIEDAHVLDLFAGTGALAIEALSRGASHAVLVEANRASAKVLTSNLERCRLDGQATVQVGDAFKWIERNHPAPIDLAGEAAGGDRSADEDHPEAQTEPAPFDMALLDPPYDFDAWPELLAIVPADVVVIEASRPVDPGPRFTTLRQRKYGSTVVTIAVSALRAGDHQQRADDEPAASDTADAPPPTAD